MQKLPAVACRLESWRCFGVFKTAPDSTLSVDIFISKDKVLMDKQIPCVRRSVNPPTLDPPHKLKDGRKQGIALHSMEKVRCELRESPPCINGEVDRFRRQWEDDIAIVEEKISQRGKELNRLHLLYNTAYESLLQCESVWKGLYEMLDIEYRDTDSEDEESSSRRQASAIETTDVDNDVGNHHENDKPGTNLAKVEMEQRMLVDTSEAIEEPCQTSKEEPQLQTTAESQTKSKALRAEAANTIKSKLKSYLSGTGSSQTVSLSEGGHGTSKTRKASARNNSTETEASSERANLTPKTSSSTAKKQMSIKSFTKAAPKLSTSNDATRSSRKRCSAPDSSKYCRTSKKHRPDATEKQADHSSTAMDPKNVTSIKKLTMVNSSSGSPSPSSSVATNTKMNTSSENPGLTETCSSTHTPKPHTSSLTTAAGNMSTTKEIANTSSTVSESQMPLSQSAQTSTPINQQQPQNSANPSQTSNQQGSSYKPLTVEEVWGVEEGSTVSKSQTASSQSSRPTTPTNQQQQLQNSSNQAKLSNQSYKPPTLTQFRRTGPSQTPQLVKELKVDMAVLGRRRTKTWHEGTLMEIRPVDGGFKYKVNFEQKGKMLLSGQHVAFTNPPMLAQLKIGSRVAARFHEGNQSWIFSAIVAELPDRKNRMRFLVFYDDGSVAYVTLPDMHLVYKPLENVWEDIEDLEQRKTVEEFVQQNYTPTVLVLHEGEQLDVMRDGQWQAARITKVDCSLVKVEFADEHSEWIYKGSERLVYVYRIRKRAQESKGKERTSSFSKPPPKPHTASTAVVLSTSTTTITTTITTTSTSTTTTATKTISSQQNSTPALGKAAVTKVSESVLKEAAGKMQPKVVLEKLSVTDTISVKTESNSASPQALLSSPSPAARPSQQGVQRPQPSLMSDSPIIRYGRLMYNPHRCCPACLDDYRPSGSNVHCGRNPLDIPTHHGFRRITGRYRTDSKVLFHVYYRSPCGRSLRTMEHLQDFLFQTRCDFLFLDMFCLDPYVLVNRAVPPGKPRACFSLPDISQGKESVPIPCFSQFDNSHLPPIEYIAKRKPAKGVYINTQTDFLVGCDCTDGCLDRSKCSCHQLTVEATALCSNGPVDTTAGYTHKRLLAPLPTGVYECNPLCRCDPRMCSNRVVQHGPQLRLELFMTHHKGWGIRCLDDVAKGTFVCTFAGEVMTDDMANTEGKVLGDEYFANLDYIEGVEALKEGYESSAYCSESEDASNEPCKNSQPKGVQVLVDSDFSEVVDHNDDDDDNDYNDEDLSDEHDGSDDSYVADDVDVDITMQRSYITRRNAKMLKVSVEVNSRDGPRPGFAVKSTHRRVKPGGVTTKPGGSKKVSPSRNTTRRLFDGEDSCYIISAGKQGNLGRYLNHSCDPNLFVQNVFVDTHDVRFPWVAYFTRKRIRAGTELTWDYNYEVGSVEGKLVLCCCGSDRCTGRLL